MCAIRDAAETNSVSANSVPRMLRASVISATVQRDLIGCKLSGPALLSVPQDRSGTATHASVIKVTLGTERFANLVLSTLRPSMRNVSVRIITDGTKLSGPALLSVVQGRSGTEKHASVRRAMPGSAKCASHAQLSPSLSMKNACASSALTGSMMSGTVSQLAGLTNTGMARNASVREIECE